MNAHWLTKRLGDIFDIARGGSPRPIEEFITDSTNGLNWIKIGDATAGGKYIRSTKEKIRPEGLSKTRFVNPGDFLLTNSMSFGRPYIMATDGCIHDGWLVLKPKYRELIDQDYFYHLLGSDTIYDRFSARASGSTVKNLNTEIVSSIEIRLPPLVEQRRIASILDKADALCSACRRTFELMGALCFAEVEVAYQGVDPTALVGDVCDVQGGLQLSRSRVGLPIEMPYLRVANVYRNRLDLTEIKTMCVTRAELERTVLAEGDILFVEGHGNPDEIGRCAVWDGSIDPCIHQNHLIRARPKSHAIDGLTISFWLNSERGRRHLLRRGKTTSGLNTISVSDVKAAAVPVLSKDKRTRLLSKLQQIDKLAKVYVRQHSRFETLFSSLQSRAFSGQL